MTHADFDFFSTRERTVFQASRTWAVVSAPIALGASPAGATAAAGSSAGLAGGLAGSGTNVAAAAIAGSAIDLKTLATLNDSVLMSHCVAPNGVGTGQWPTFQAGIELLTLTNVKTRWGLFDSNADPAGDGIWIEFDPTLSSGQYRLICSRGGVQTVVVNSLGFTGAGISSLRWRIDVQPGRATFYVASSGAPNPQLWVYLATITTNVPITTTAMGAGVFLKTTAAAIASVRIGDMKLVQRVNYL